MRKIILPLLLLCLALPAMAAPSAITIGNKATSLENLAAKELQRYLYQITGKLLPIETEDTAGFALGTPKSSKYIAKMSKELDIKGLGEEGYQIKHEGDKLIIAANTPNGVLYGVYALLEEYGVGFSLGGDELPKQQSLRLLEIDKSAKPSLKIRGVLPWYNFYNSPTTWNPEDYRAFCDNLARMKMNFIGFHAYDYEPFTGYKWKGEILGGKPLASSVNNVFTWGTTLMKTDEFGFGTGQYFDGPAFGASPSLGYSTPEEGIERAKAVLRDALNYAKGRGLKTCVGFEVSGNPADPESQQKLEARLRQVLSDYPSLDYLWIWETEAMGARGIQPPASNDPFAAYYYRYAKYFSDIKDTKRVAEAVRIAVYTQRAYDILKRISPQTRLVISGWGGDHHLRFTDFFPGYDQILPKDIIFSALDDIATTPQISRAYAKVKNHEKWPIPWFEYDGDQWHPQPKLKSFEQLSKMTYQYGCQGLLGIHWRTRGVDEAAGYAARIAWEPDLTRLRFLEELARLRYGEKYASDLAKIHLEMDDLGYRWVGGRGQAEYAPFSWGPGNDPVKIQKLNEIGQKLDQLTASMKSNRDLGAADRVRYARRTIDWVLAFEKAEENLVPGGPINEKLKAAKAASGDEARKLASEALQMLRNSGLDHALRTLGVNVTNQGELGVLATVNMKAYASYRGMVKQAQAILGVNSDPAVTTPEKIPAQPEVRVINRASVVDPGEDLTIRALGIEASDANLVLHYRKPGERAYQTVPMNHTNGFWHAAVIPGAQINDSGVEYYISLTDKSGAVAYAPAAFPQETFVSVAWSGPVVPKWTSAPQPEPEISPDPIIRTNINPFLVEMEWKRGIGAAFYRLYRSESPENPGAAVADIRDTWYEDGGIQSGTQYYYRIAPVGENAKIGRLSKPFRVRVPKVGSVTPPKNLQAIAGRGRILLSWDTDGHQVTGYKVYRIDTTGKETLLTQTPVQALPDNNNSYNDYPSAQETFRYKVTAVFTNGFEGAPAMAGPIKVQSGDVTPIFQAKRDSNGKYTAQKQVNNSIVPVSPIRAESNWVEYQHDSIMNASTGFTAVIHAKLDTPDGMPVLLAHGYWGGSGYFVQIFNGKIRFFLAGVGYLDIGDMPVGRWVNLALVYNGTTMETYIDGKSAGKKDAYGTPSPYNGPFYIGRYPAEDGRFFVKGSVDQVLIYPDALTPDEISRLKSN